MKSRVAIAAILMLGLLTGGTGTTLALEGSDNASQAQYGGGQPQNRVLGTTQQGGEGQGPSGVLGTTESSPQSSGNGVQGSQQVAAADGGDSLPFTGLAAVPLIALGLGLMLIGGMLYRSARREPTSA